MNGNTTIISRAAKHAANLGIIVCNAMGNSGPSDTSITAPADADSILSIGAVTFEAAPASVQEMVARADAAMYAAKRAGKGWIRVEVVRPSAAGAAPAAPADPSAAPGPRPARPLPA
jgi:predicted signal transduction protein with EAL and GGDEF domain